MIYTFIVRTNHLNSSVCALEQVRTVIAQQHIISCIYFLFDGAYLANKYIDMPTDEINLSREWQNFARDNALELLVCSASGLRRGICPETIATGFRFGSIGELVESCAAADQVVCI